MNKKVIAASLLSTFTVGTSSNISAKNKIIEFINNHPELSFIGSSVVALPITFVTLFAINKLNRSESQESDWFKMLGGTKKDIDNYKNLLKNYEITVNFLEGIEKKGFNEDVSQINKDVQRTVELDKKHHEVLRRILKICALHDNPFKNKGVGQYVQGYNFWCALIIKKFANNSDSISEDTEAKIYFVYKNIVEVLLLLVDENSGQLEKGEIYSGLRESFQNQNKLSDLQMPKLIKDDDGNYKSVQYEILSAFDHFLIENDKMLLIDKLILDATADGSFNPKIALQTIANKVYEIIIKYYDKFLVDEKKKISENTLSNDFDAAIYQSLFFKYMKKQIK